MSGNSAKVSEKWEERPQVREKSGKGQRIWVVIEIPLLAANTYELRCAWTRFLRLSYNSPALYS